MGSQVLMRGKFKLGFMVSCRHSGHNPDLIFDLMFLNIRLVVMVLLCITVIKCTQN